uniref:Uncharacterized protein n=1 Tax=Microviridae sp. ctMqy3 TaxID=2824995 RepID=A0A8S5VEY9_9VIRU|nr:MAG TPA: hypothetical protein [Microviridae sp. ctMqy3]
MPAALCALVPQNFSLTSVTVRETALSTACVLA